MRAYVHGSHSVKIAYDERGNIFVLSRDLPVEGFDFW